MNKKLTEQAYRNKSCPEKSLQITFSKSMLMDKKHRYV